MVTLYGISNCDTVKKARRWLDEQAVAYRFHDFRKDGLTPAQVDSWLEQVGAEILLNKRGTTWRQLSPEQQQRAAGKQLCALLTEHPAMIKRPLLEAAGRPLLVGFSAERYREHLAG